MFSKIALLKYFFFISLIISFSSFSCYADSQITGELLVRGNVYEVEKGRYHHLFDRINNFRGPIIGKFHCEAGGVYQLFTGVKEEYWHEKGKRVIDIAVNGEKVATLDCFKDSFNTPNGHICTVRADKNGVIKVQVTANPLSEDKNVSICGFLLFDRSADISVDSVISKQAPKELAIICPNPSGILCNLDDLDPEKRIKESIDGRLCFGNGYVLGSFVGPFEFPEHPVTEVHDKIARLWLGYASSQLVQIGLAPRVTNLKTGQSWVVGDCDEYEFTDGVMILRTEIEPGTVTTRTYGLWEKPVMVRQIEFEPKADSKGEYEISTCMSLYRGFEYPQDNKQRKQLKLCEDSREWPRTIKLNEKEKIVKLSERLLLWDYDDKLRRKTVVGSGDAKTTIKIEDAKKVYLDSDYGTVRFSKRCCRNDNRLSVILSFDKNAYNAVTLGKEAINDYDYINVQQKWRQWYEKGCTVAIGNKKADKAFRDQCMYMKLAIDAELGGMIVGSRYELTTVWTRDSGVGMSVLLDCGRYEEVKKILEFFSTYAYWNKVNNCLHANYHSSGRVLQKICSDRQRGVEDITEPGEWYNQMVGPQLDGMCYYLYVMGKYYRYTRDLDFVKSQWSFYSKVADALAKDDYCLAEWDNAKPNTQYLDGNKKYKKYNERTGLIIDDCLEQKKLAEYTLTNGLAVLGFKQAWLLSKELGDERPLWKERSEQLNASVKKHCIVTNETGQATIIGRQWRPDIGVEGYRLGDSGYDWTLAATVPYFNYKNQLFKTCFARQVSPDAKIVGWGMWWATLAHAAFEADLPEYGWNYLSQLLENLPPSLQIYELNHDVAGPDGIARNAVLTLFGYTYYPHAILRGFAGFGYDEIGDYWFFRPQIPDEFGTIKSRIRIGDTWFNVISSGNGDKLEKFIIDGIEVSGQECRLPERYIDGGTHTVIISMR